MIWLCRHVNPWGEVHWLAHLGKCVLRPAPGGGEAWLYLIDRTTPNRDRAKTFPTEADALAVLAMCGHPPGWAAWAILIPQPNDKNE